jgi:hypothetical protein
MARLALPAPSARARQASRAHLAPNRLARTCNVATTLTRLAKQPNVIVNTLLVNVTRQYTTGRLFC